MKTWQALKSYGYKAAKIPSHSFVVIYSFMRLGAELFFIEWSNMVVPLPFVLLHSACQSAGRKNLHISLAYMKQI